MADISKLNAVPLANIEKLDAVLAANIAKVNGLVFTSAAAQFLLDQYTGAAAGYSTRRLASSATVLMRVRRETAGGTGDDDEADVAYDSNNELSLDSAISNASVGVTATTLGQFLNVGTVNGTTYTNPDSLTVTASCFVDEWKDQSGNANHAEQATHGSQPQIHDGTVNTDLITENGKPALSFNSDEFDFTITGNVNSFSTYTVATNDATSGSHMQFALSVNPRWWHWYQSGNAQFWYGNQTITHSAFDQSQHLSVMIAGSTLGHAGYWIDNVKASSTATLITSAFDGSEKIGDYPTGGNPWEGTMQELIMWPTDESENRTGIEENINSDYLIYQPTDAPTSGLLATYTGAAAAYSVRQLSDKAVIALRIRRDSDDEETNIGFDSNGDLATADISAFCGTANGYVTRWWDQSTNGNHADQATDASQPQIYNGTAVITENGKPAIYFADKTRTIASSLGANSITTCDFVGVNRRASGTGYVYFWYQSLFQVTEYLSTSYSLGLSRVAGPTADTSQHLDYHVVSNGTGFIRRDGTAYSSGTLDVNRYFSGNFGINNRPGFTTYNAPEIYHQEFIIWNSNQSATNRTGIESDINTYFSIY